MCCLAAVAAPGACSPARHTREATLGGLVSTITSPFFNFKNGILNLFKPRAPKHNSYRAPAPAPVYVQPAPVYVAAVPAAPAEQVRGSPAAPKPQILILPAPDLATDAPAPAAPAAPAEEVRSSGAAETPAVPPPFEEAPIYTPESFDPAPVDAEVAEELREAKAFVGSPVLNQIQVETEKPTNDIIIDLTEDVEEKVLTTEKAEAETTTTAAEEPVAVTTVTVETEQPENEVATNEIQPSSAAPDVIEPQQVKIINFSPVVQGVQADSITTTVKVPAPTTAAATATESTTVAVASTVVALETTEAATGLSSR